MLSLIYSGRGEVIVELNLGVRNREWPRGVAAAHSHTAQPYHEFRASRGTGNLKGRLGSHTAHTIG
jgi:hypothetical protein